jgi:excisionase family DNA binding protein
LQLVDVRAACATLHVSRSSLYKLIDAGALPPVRLGRSIRFAVRDLEALIERQRGAARADDAAAIDAVDARR